MKLDNILQLLRKDVRVELRQKSAVAGIVLFTITTVFILFKAFNEIKPQIWNILVWVVTIFAGVNAIVKAFIQEKSETYVYYYTTINPLEFLVAKLVYNYLFLLALITIILAAFILFTGLPFVEAGDGMVREPDYWLFIRAVMLGVFGIALIFTFVSSISGASGGNATLMSILALPLVLPSVLTLIKITSVSLRLMQDSAINKDLWILFGIDILLLGAVLSLFPIVWKG
jgi:heme exporter protein B